MSTKPTSIGAMRRPVQSDCDASRATFRIMSEPRPEVAEMPWSITAIKICIAGALLVWAIFG
jgi:hypothetical protein